MFVYHNKHLFHRNDMPWFETLICWGDKGTTSQVFTSKFPKEQILTIRIGVLLYSQIRFFFSQGRTRMWESRGNTKHLLIYWLLWLILIPETEKKYFPFYMQSIMNSKETQQIYCKTCRNKFQFLWKHCMWSYISQVTDCTSPAE